MMKMHHEGFGRLVLIAGRLFVGDRTNSCDAYCFGFESFEKLAAEAERIVSEACAMIEKFPGGGEVLGPPCVMIERIALTPSLSRWERDAFSTAASRPFLSHGERAGVRGDLLSLTRQPVSNGAKR